MIRCLIAAVAALSLAACATDPAKIAVTPQSKTGLIVLAVEPVPLGEYQVYLRGYDRGDRKLGANSTRFDVEPSLRQTFIVAEAPADTYVFQQVGQQYTWAVCFHAESVAFDLKPGEVVYVGKLDSRVNLQQLRELAIASRKLTASQGTIHHFVDDIKPPALTPPAEADLAAVRAHLAATSPLVTAPARAAVLEPARFGAGKDLFGLQNSCGGWYAGSAKDE